MAKKKPASAPTASAPSPQIYEASLGANYSVIKGQPLTQAQAETRRQSGKDVVVCGGDHKANRRLAEVIERNANGKIKPCPPHYTYPGSRALPHWQPDPRPPDGHTFY